MTAAAGRSLVVTLHRPDDQFYLVVARRWFAAWSQNLAAHLAPRCAGSSTASRWPAERALFLRASRILELPFCAIDYAHTPDGSIVVREANPHPIIPEPWVSDEVHLRRFAQAMTQMLLADKNGVSATCALP